jgi:hypothetical protein
MDIGIKQLAKSRQARQIVALFVCWSAVYVCRQFSMRDEITPTEKLVALKAYVPLSIFAVFFSGFVFYSLTNAISVRRSIKMLQRYPGVYLVRSLPSELVGLIANGSFVQVGDYGWEAEPLRHDGLIYLHGLGDDWNIQWYAGVSYEQIEFVCNKPWLQYDVPYSWHSRPPQCPYVVKSQVERKQSLGLPVRLMGEFVQGRRLLRE